MTTKPQDDAVSQPGDVRSSAQLGLAPERADLQAKDVGGAVVFYSREDCWVLEKKNLTWHRVESVVDQIGRLRAIGGQLANVAFNWSQESSETGSRLTEGERAMLKDLQRQWDKALRA